MLQQPKISLIEASMVLDLYAERYVWLHMPADQVELLVDGMEYAWNKGPGVCAEAGTVEVEYAFEINSFIARLPNIGSLHFDLLPSHGLVIFGKPSSWDSKEPQTLAREMLKQGIDAIAPVNNSLCRGWASSMPSTISMLTGRRVENGQEIHPNGIFCICRGGTHGDGDEWTGYFDSTWIRWVKEAFCPRWLIDARNQTWPVPGIVRATDKEQLLERVQQRLKEYEALKVRTGAQAAYLEDVSALLKLMEE